MRREQRSPEAQAYHRWYNLKIWRGIREAQLTAEPLCRMCLQQNVETIATHCDHIEPHKGDWLKFIHGPFQSLCTTHHNSTKQSDERTGSQKGVDANGFPTDPNHPWVRTSP